MSCDNNVNKEILTYDKKHYTFIVNNSDLDINVKCWVNKQWNNEKHSSIISETGWESVQLHMQNYVWRT